MIEALPNNHTKHDLCELQSALKKNLLDKIYDLSGSELIFKSYCSDSNVVSLSLEYIDMFAGLSDMLRKESVDVNFDQIEMINFLPARNHSYREYKSGCKTRKLAGSTIIYHPDTAPIVTYTLSEDHPFEVRIKEEKLFFDSLDCALKISYENSDFITAGAKQMKQMMESEEGQRMAESVANDIKATIDANRDFAKSERFEAILGRCKKLICNGNIHADGWQSLELNDEGEFYSFFDAALTKGELLECPDATFKTQFVVIGELKFCMMHGQGTVYFIEANK